MLYTKVSCVNFTLSLTYFANSEIFQPCLGIHAATAPLPPGDVGWDRQKNPRRDRGGEGGGGVRSPYTYIYILLCMYVICIWPIPQTQLLGRTGSGYLSATHSYECVADIYRHVCTFVVIIEVTEDSRGMYRVHAPITVTSVTHKYY